MTKPVNLIVVDSDGELITSANGQVSGPHLLVKRVKQADVIGTPVRLVEPFGTLISAKLDEEDNLSTTAALFAANPGRTRLLEAPADVWEWIEEDSDEFGEPYSTDTDDDHELTEEELHTLNNSQASDN